MRHAGKLSVLTLAMTSSAKPLQSTAGCSSMPDLRGAGRGAVVSKKLSRDDEPLIRLQGGPSQAWLWRLEASSLALAEESVGEFGLLRPELFAQTLPSAGHGGPQVTLSLSQGPF